MLLRFSALNDFIEPGNPVRFIDALVDKIELHQIDICHISTYKQKSTATDNGGAPSFDLKLMLKLYLYGYLKKIRSSRKLEQECKRNIELHWLIQKLILAQRIPRCRGQKQGKPCGKPQRIQAQASHRRTSLRHLKREWGYTYTLLKGLEKVDGEMNLNFLCYNIKRGLHILGIKNIQNALKNWQPDYAKAILRFILAQIRAKYSPNMTIKICNKIYTKKNIHPLLPFINQIPTFKN